MQHKGEPRRQVRGRYPSLGENEAPGIKKVSLSERQDPGPSVAGYQDYINYPLKGF